jgi:hypothetical protein
MGDMVHRYQDLATKDRHMLTSNLMLKLFGAPREAPYEVLDTDYVTYSVVYTCSHVFMGIGTFESLWVFSRSQLVAGTRAWSAFQKTVLGVINSKLGSKNKLG